MGQMRVGEENCMWQVRVPGLELPEGWSAKEDADFLHLYNEKDEVVATFAASGATKESIEAEVRRLLTAA